MTAAPALPAARPGPAGLPAALTQGSRRRRPRLRSRDARLAAATVDCTVAQAGRASTPSATPAVLPPAFAWVLAPHRPAVKASEGALAFGEVRGAPCRYLGGSRSTIPGRNAEASVSTAALLSSTQPAAAVSW